MHLSDEQLQRLLHDEVDADSEARLREHVRVCSDCSVRVDEARGEEAELFQLLGALDHTPPVLTADVVAARARVRRAPRLRWAAAIALAIGAASVTYAMPNSQLRAWVHGLFVDAADQTPTVEVESVAAPSAATAGIAVEPGEHLVIQFVFANGGRARVVLGDGHEIAVRVGAGAASFTDQTGRLVIDNRDPTAMFEIRIPRAASHVEIMAGAHRLFSKQQTRITSDVPEQTDGSYSLQLNAPGD